MPKLTMDDPYGTYETESRGFTPDARSYGVETIAPGISDVADAIRVQGEDWISSVSRAMGQVAMADYQRRLLNVQLERARQGLPPLDASQYGATVNVQAPQLNYLMLVGLAAVAFLLLRRR
jgi:hypothetical protein